MYFMLWILCNFASFKGKQKVIKKEKKKEKKIRKKGKEQNHIWYSSYLFFYIFGNSYENKKKAPQKKKPQNMHFDGSSLDLLPLLHLTSRKKN